MGARHVRVYVNSTLAFEGELEKGCGNQVFDYSNCIELQESHPPECTSPSPVSSRRTLPDHDNTSQESSSGQAHSPRVETSPHQDDQSERSAAHPVDRAAEMQRDSLESDSPPLDLTLPSQRTEEEFLERQLVTTQPSSSRIPRWLRPADRSGPDGAEGCQERDRPPWLQPRNTEPKHSVLPDISCNPVRACKQASGHTVAPLDRTTSGEFSSDSLDLDPDLGLNSHEREQSTQVRQESREHHSDRDLDLWDARVKKPERPVSGRRSSANKPQVMCSGDLITTAGARASIMSTVKVQSNIEIVLCLSLQRNALQRPAATEDRNLTGVNRTIH